MGDGNVPVGRDSTGPAAPGQPSPVAEALWVADESGVLRAFDGRTNEVSARVDIGRSAFPPVLGVGGGLVWVYRDDGGVVLVDPVTARVTRRAMVVPARPLADNRLSYAHRALWIAQPGRLWRVSTSGKVSSIQLPADFKATVAAATDRWLWLAGGRRLVRVDPEGQTVTVAGELPVDVEIGHLSDARSRLLAVGWNKSEIWVLDPDSGALESSIKIPDGELVMSVVSAGDDVWAMGNCGHAVRVTGTEHPQVHKVQVSNVSQDLGAAAAIGSLWVADEGRSELVRIDLQTAEVIARLPVTAADPDDPAFAVVAGQHSVWLIDTNLANGVLHVDPTTNRVLRLTSSIGVSLGVSAVVAPPPP
ncbi:hypothetical protein SAMN04489832_0726 [Micromonospora cremea]|uniref:40-residue YVTN family beta-propeller repeat-containing protein n=2 Tax=Micromonospora cremea TaxID=709881 RepID=A0A1N5UC04_9ACTN|nr:hypothetical protein SAMN04489832_0726 [Micromonospora cremea]